MGKYYKVNEINQLMKEIQKQTMDALTKQCGKDIFNAMKQYMLENIYEAYEPRVYQRTEKLLNSLTVSPVIRKGNIISIKVYIPNEIINDSSHEMWYDVKQLGLSEGDNPTLSEVMEILERGLNKYREETHVVDDTYQYLMSTNVIIKGLINYLKSKGFNVI